MAELKKKPQRRSVAQAKRVSGMSGHARPVADTPAQTKPAPSVSANFKSAADASSRFRAALKESGRAKPAAKPTASVRRISYSSARKPSVTARTHIRWPQFLFLFLLLAVIASAGLFVWDRWFRFDDVRDFQGQWTAEQTAMPVIIDGKRIELSTDLAYSYTLNTWDKSISYTFDDLSGSATYRFSPDRKKLVIIEGGTDDWILFAKIALGLSEPEEGAGDEETTILIRGENLLPDAQGSTGEAGAVSEEGEQDSESAADSDTVDPTDASEGDNASAGGAGEDGAL